MTSASLIGTVVSVRGAVVDVGFDGEMLPPINTALIVEWDRPERLILEVHSHVDPTTVRVHRASGDRRPGARHESARDRRAHFGPGRRCGSGTPSRRRRDGSRPRARPASRYPASRHPQSAAGARGRDLDQRGLRDRHQGDRPACAARPGRQGRDVRRGRRRQDRAGHGTDPRHGREIQGHLGLCRGRRAFPRGPRVADRHAEARACSLARCSSMDR